MTPEKLNNCSMAINELSLIIEGCVFETDRHKHDPDSILWHRYISSLKTLKDAGFKIGRKL